jgi:Rieske Fe-S protein
MVAAQILTDMVMDKDNQFSPVFSPQRKMHLPSLAANAFESTVNMLTPTTRRCPHMGCALSWNKAEHSWDCSCHGSRFSASGKLMENPAIRDADIDDTKK